MSANKSSQRKRTEPSLSPFDTENIEFIPSNIFNIFLFCFEILLLFSNSLNQVVYEKRKFDGKVMNFEKQKQQIFEFRFVLGHTVLIRNLPPIPQT